VDLFRSNKNGLIIKGYVYASGMLGLN